MKNDDWKDMRGSDFFFDFVATKRQTCAVNLKVEGDGDQEGILLFSVVGDRMLVVLELRNILKYFGVSLDREDYVQTISTFNIFPCQ